MIFPRLFTCLTVSTRTFKVDFEVNLVVLFSDGHLLTENFPLKIVRHKEAGPGPSGPSASLGAKGGAEDDEASSSGHDSGLAPITASGGPI